MIGAVTPGKVQAALRAEGRKLDAKHRGSHVFTPIWACDDVGGCNWTTNYRVTGSSLDLGELRATLERVQAKMPIVEFDYGADARMAAMDGKRYFVTRIENASCRHERASANYEAGGGASRRGEF